MIWLVGLLLSFSSFLPVPFSLYLSLYVHSVFFPGKRTFSQGLFEHSEFILFRCGWENDKVSKLFEECTAVLAAEATMCAKGNIKDD